MSGLLLGLAWSRRHRTQDQIRVRAALHALLTVIAPSCSLWPSRYTKLVKQASVSPDNCIVLPLHMFIQDVLDGVVELRDPLKNLADLTHTGVKANGWNICIGIDPRSWVNTLGFYFTHKLDRVLAAFGWPTLRSVSAIQSKAVAKIPVLRSSCDPFRLLLWLSSDANVNLDCQPMSDFKEMKPGTRLTLEFTSLSPVVRGYGASHVLAILPFVLASRDPLGPLRHPRKLTRILEMLTDKRLGDVVVHSVKNVSTVYQKELARVYERISEDDEFRKMLLNAFGVQRWRHQKFQLALEATLLREGLIEKWVIEVSKQ
ncbi:hypothetical protein V8B97DRAFT_1915362 [Scleroderma yunnanense]